MIYEKRVRAQYHAQGDQKRIAREFNKKVKPRNLKEGDLVLKVLRDETFDSRGKMKPGWSGPFIIKKIMSRSVTRITDLDREEMFCPISMDRLQRYNIKKKIKNKRERERERSEKKFARLKNRNGGLGKRTLLD